MRSMTRREFVRLGATTVAAGAAVNATLLEPLTMAAQSPANDAGRKIRFVSIGTGIRGCDLLRSARQVPNGELVGTADLYDMHQKAGLEAYGVEVPTTRDYRTLLDRKDVDAVIVAVADFQHRHVVLDCLAAGKDVYCEKPMSHNVADGLAMVKAVQEGKLIFQAGSQRVSNIVYKKAAEIYASGRLGESITSKATPIAIRPRVRGFIPSPRMQARRRSTGLRGFAMHPRGLSTRRDSSGGAASAITAKASRAICTSIFFPAFSASVGSIRRRREHFLLVP
jgi:hypothetical protein